MTTSSWRLLRLAIVRQVAAGTSPQALADQLGWPIGRVHAEISQGLCDLHELLLPTAES